MKTVPALLALSGLLVTTVPAQEPARDLETWTSRSEPRTRQGRRCLAPVPDPSHVPVQADAALQGGPGDCAYVETNPAPYYTPTFVYEIPVVFHVIQDSSGGGYLSLAQLQSQVEVFNEDFRALAGSNGALGYDTMIQFKIATVDPNGIPRLGVTYSMNDTWFNDGGQYWNALAWDTNRYLNIYTNRPGGGTLGYVPALPQTGAAGNKFDRAVVLWSTIGKNAAYGLPWDQGRIATHEVGHYLGLWHTFDNGCGNADRCYTTGDYICDTKPQSGPTAGCPTSRSSCGHRDPIHNYMDYTDDACIWEFTPEQAKRMRCSIEHWRPQLARVLHFDEVQPGSSLLVFPPVPPVPPVGGTER